MPAVPAPVAPYMAVGLSTVVRGISRRSEIARNLDTIEDAIHAAASIIGINMPVRLIALADRVAMRVERADFDDLVTLVTQAPPWEKDRAAGVRLLLRAIDEGKPDAPDQILAR